MGEPLLLFFFLEDGSLRGRLKGGYELLEDNNLYLQAEIDPFTPIFGGQFDSLANYPQRYYDFEAITQNGIQGKVTFYENGFDSQFGLRNQPEAGACAIGTSCRHQILDETKQEALHWVQILLRQRKGS